MMRSDFLPTGRMSSMSRLRPAPDSLEHTAFIQVQPTFTKEAPCGEC